MRPIEEIHDAFHRILRVAAGESKEAFMSIPADPRRDADLIVSEAIRELHALRAEVQSLKADRGSPDTVRAMHEESLKVVREVAAERDALRAEVERLRNSRPHMEAMAAKLEAKALQEKLARAEDERESLRAEVERLNALAEHFDAERKLLRGALLNVDNIVGDISSSVGKVVQAAFDATWDERKKEAP